MRLPRLSVLVLAASLVPACVPQRAHVAPPVDPEPDPPVQTDATVVATPEPARPLQLEVETSLANRFVKADAPAELLARVTIHSPPSGDSPRPKANIGLVVDTSSSMEGDAIEQARRAAITLIDDLRDGDVLSVTTFGSGVRVLVPAAVVDAKSRPAMRKAIEQMEALGTTDLAGGLQAGLQQVQSRIGGDQINRIVLLSDGVPNDEGPIVGLAQHARTVGVPITALGLGLEFHETLLGQIAEASGGKFHFVEQADTVATVFRDEVLSIERLAARGLSVTLSPGPGVEIVEVVGLAAGRSGRQMIVGLPDLAEGETQQIIVKLATGEHRDGATIELFDGLVGYADARTNVGTQVNTFAAARATADAAMIEQGVDLDVALAAARATTAAATLQIVALARSGRVKLATDTLDATVAHAKAIGSRMPDAELTRLVDDLVELRPTLAKLAPPPPSKDKGTLHAPSTGMGMGMGRGQSPAMVDGAGGLGMMSPEGARGVRASHERAYKTLHGG